LEATDRDLIGLCRRNRRDGYDLLFQKYERYIYKICYFYAPSKEDALDLLQEIFLNIFRSLDKFDESKPLLPWIKRISVNACINYVKKNKGSPVSLDQTTDNEDNKLENILVSNENTEETYICRDTKNILEESIKELPNEMRMAIILRHIRGYSYRAISDIMSIPEGTVKTYIYRGRCLLKEKLKTKGVWEV